MRATAPDRRAVLLVLAGAALAAGERINDVLARLASALSDADAAAFLRPFDPAMPGYAELRRNVRALLAAGPAGSSIEPLEERGEGPSRTVRVNWILDLEGRRRERDVSMEFERRRGKWRIVRLAPVDFFAP